MSSLEQSNVDMIEKCLDTPPDEHRMEQEEEWWYFEVGEQPAVFLSIATVYGSWFADLLVWMAKP